MKQIFTKEARIGIVSIISLVLLYIGINYLKGINLFKPVNHYYVECNNVKGVTVSSPVYVEGFKVGLVREINYDYAETGKIRIEISLDDKMRINKGSYITIVNSFLGGGELNINLNKYIDDYLKPGSSIEGRMETDMMQSVQENILPQVEVLLPKIDSILSGLQTLVNHPALSASLDHISVATSALSESSKKLDKLMANDLPVIMNNVKTITDNFTEVSDNMKQLDLASTINSVNATLKQVEQMTEKMNAKDNSLGLLLNDRSLYDNLDSTAYNASKLLLDLKQNPKRYVHFSVF
jgi:phospholipid/cholesterol/gamma-HCH transport system substrate-binding protein